MRNTASQNEPMAPEASLIVALQLLITMPSLNVPRIIVPRRYIVERGWFSEMTSVSPAVSSRTNFVKTILRLAGERERLTIIAD